MSSLDDRGPEIHEAVVARTSAIVHALSALDEDGLGASSRLPDWSRLTIACHLRYGAETLTRMTTEVIAGQRASYYPEGRAEQRDGTLRPRDGETARDVVASLAGAGDALHEAWAKLGAEQWTVVAHEPHDNPDIGSVPLVVLALLRLTEVEVHGGDLDLGLPDWSAQFVELALPFRFARLNARRPDPRARDLLAVLLGRPRREPIGLRGDPHVAGMFQRVFPGP